MSTLDYTDEEIEATNDLEYCKQTKSWYIEIFCEAEELSFRFTAQLLNDITERKN